MDLNALTMQIDREHDACGIYSRIEKSAEPTYKSVETGIQALRALRHRAGYVQGEGDGCGLLLDVPRRLWKRWYTEQHKAAETVDSPAFFVAHLFVQRDGAGASVNQVIAYLEKAGCTELLVRQDQVNHAALGPAARAQDPVFVQIAGVSASEANREMIQFTAHLESMSGVHVASLSRTTVVYKVVGDGDTLFAYYLDLQDDSYLSTYVLAHTRYSTNTATSFSRVQPFALLGHNGEVNTISRFYTEASMIGVELDANFSDSQMVDGVLHHLTAGRDWTLFEALELLFPPIVHEVKQMPKELSDMYMFLRAMWGPFAQGPAAIMSRFGSEAVYSVDALGLRPLWIVETGDAYHFSSEQGIIPSAYWVKEPRALAPGEKVGVSFHANGTTLWTYPELQREVFQRLQSKYRFQGESQSIHFAVPYPNPGTVSSHPYRDLKPLPIRTAAFGWREDDIKALEFETQTGAEPIRSLGYDGPLPILDSNLRLLSDFLQETVAVVTNPAIDREREIEHFSTRTVLGKRPSISGQYQDAHRVETQSPLLLEELPEYTGIQRDELQNVAHRYGTLLYEDALAELRTNVYGTVEILLHREEGESIEDVLARFQQEALEAVQAGANVIVLDDRLQFVRGAHIDPFLATAAVHRSLLRPASGLGGEYLRRRTSLVLRSGGLRNLHDIATAIGLGADAVNPYLIWEMAANRGNLQAVENIYTALCKGIEKVLSTIGIHEVRGYERLFAAIGLENQIAQTLGVPNFCGTDTVGYGFKQMEEEALQRAAIYHTSEEKRVARQRIFQLYPRIWKSAGQVAQGDLDYPTYFEKLNRFEQENPINLRHLLAMKTQQQAPEDASVIDEVDTTVDIHNLPFVISSMSFGSQGETAYRAYAEAAYRLNIVGLNGEGGEIKDLLTKYPRNRGRQVASGRFGVNAELCNGTYVLEIKIGQGAKPGEGGHLPGSKVTIQVANARNASPGIDLISPSNNHDIYSIEDLAQVIHELRTINPYARIAVKVPVVPNIGTIAVGIVKAGAHIVTLSGFDGGTGAARAHAIRHVGLPMEIGVKLAHDALCQSGLRECAEIWADGGIKSGADVMKAILLGANRVGFGTMAMVALGCTSCRACHKDTCHVGIATQMTDMEEALAKGITTFSPREFDSAVEHLVRFFTAVGQHVKELTYLLGATRTQDLVGRRDLLKQFSTHTEVDVSWLLQIHQSYAGLGSRITYGQWHREELEVAHAESTLAMAAGTEDLVAATNAASGSGMRNPHRIYQLERSDEIRMVPRALGTFESGEHTRNRAQEEGQFVYEYAFVAGNGFAAYHTFGMTSIARGGAQDGVGKGAYGGKIVVLKRKCTDGSWRGGSVGKGLAYGAQHGVFIVQGDADARAGIRLSGADVIIGGEVHGRIQDEFGWIGARSNIKGFAFEYMTNGRALVLGDPGPWICSGMTGGTVYVRCDDSVGLTEAALRRRIARGAKVSIQVLDLDGMRDVTELLQTYQLELRKSGQKEAADDLAFLIANPVDNFRMIRPGESITDQTIATE